MSLLSSLSCCSSSLARALSSFSRCFCAAFSSFDNEAEGGDDDGPFDGGGCAGAGDGVSRPVVGGAGCLVDAVDVRRMEVKTRVGEAEEAREEEQTAGEDRLVELDTAAGGVRVDGIVVCVWSRVVGGGGCGL